MVLVWLRDFYRDFADRDLVHALESFLGVQVAHSLSHHPCFSDKCTEVDFLGGVLMGSFSSVLLGSVEALTDVGREQKQACSRRRNSSGCRALTRIGAP